MTELRDLFLEMFLHNQNSSCLLGRRCRGPRRRILGALDDDVGDLTWYQRGFQADMPEEEKGKEREKEEAKAEEEEGFRPRKKEERKNALT